MKWYLWIEGGSLDQSSMEAPPVQQESQAGLIVLTLIGGGCISFVLGACVPLEFWHAAFWGCYSLFVAVGIWRWRKSVARFNPAPSTVEVTNDIITVTQFGKVTTLLCKDICFIRGQANKHVQWIELSSETEKVKFMLATKAGDACGHLLYSKCEHAAYMDRRNKEHFPDNLDRADSIWTNLLKYNTHEAIDSLACGSAFTVGVAAFLWFYFDKINLENAFANPKLSLTVAISVVAGIVFLTTGTLRWIRWRTKVKQMTQLKDAGDFEGALKLIVERK